LVLAAAGNKSATRPPLPLPGCGGEWKRNRQKLVGRDKGSLTEQQTKGTGTTTIQKKGVTQNKPAEQSPQSRTALSDRTAAEPSRATSPGFEIFTESTNSEMLLIIEQT